VHAAASPATDDAPAPAAEAVMNLRRLRSGKSRALTAMISIGQSRQRCRPDQAPGGQILHNASVAGSSPAMCRWPARHRCRRARARAGMTMAQPRNRGRMRPLGAPGSAGSGRRPGLPNTLAERAEHADLRASDRTYSTAMGRTDRRFVRSRPPGNVAHLAGARAAGGGEARRTGRAAGPHNPLRDADLTERVGREAGQWTHEACRCHLGWRE
jgi:hypothetical protein